MSPKVSEQVVTFLFLEINLTMGLSEDSPSFERPACTRANTGTVSLSRPMSGRKAGRSMSGRDRVRAHGGGISKNKK